LVADKQLFMDHVHMTRSEIAETGEYDLDGLFIRIADAVERVGARRSFSTRLKRCSASCPIPPSCARKSAACSVAQDQGLTTVITAERDNADS
jgi:circadian clock protein KaiC